MEDIAVEENQSMCPEFIRDVANELKKNSRGHATLDMHRSIASIKPCGNMMLYHSPDITCEDNLGLYCQSSTIVGDMLDQTKHLSAKVRVPGCEWPGSEWDFPNAWYQGSIIKETRTHAHVQFDGEDETLTFDKQSLDNYQELYDAYKIGTLLEAALSPV